MSTTELKRRIPRKAGVFAAFAAVLLAVGTSLAVHDATGPMELDGNIADDAGAATDWQAIFNASGAETGSLPAGRLDTTNVIKDFATGASGPDNSYHAPSNKDDQQILATGASDVWGCVSVSNPTDKTDIVNAYGMAVQGDAQTGDGDTGDDQLFYFGVERFDNSGDAFIGLWLFQADVTCNPVTGKFEGAKQTGDVLVLANFTNGGSTGTIQLFRYTAGATATSPGTFSQLGAAGKCSSTNLGDLAAPLNDICASINPDKFTTPWPMEDKDKPQPSGPDPVNEVDTNQFVEGGVNLTDLFAGAGAGAPPCFGSFLAETRSSSSLDATLKDFALGDLNFCDARVKIEPSQVNRVGDPHTFTVDVEQQLGAGFVAAPTGDVTYTLTGSNGITASDITVLPGGTTCSNSPGDDLDPSGQCTIQVVSSKTGLITANASVAVNVGGTSLVRDTDPGTAAVSGYTPEAGPAVKTYVDATIDITGDGTNRVGVSHSFTATVKVDSGNGSGLVAASGVTVTIQKTDANGATSSPSGNQTCTTGPAGTCSVSFSSPTTGTTTGTASATVTAAGLSFGINTTDDAAVTGNEAVVKTWVDATIDITGDGSNRVNDSHEFTVLVETDDGSGNGLQPASGIVVTPTLTDSNGAAAVVDDDPDTDSTCDDGTDGNGECVVKFNSATTGVTTGTASASVTLAGLTFSVNTTDDASIAANQDATKTWVDARIGITGDDTNSIEEPHTFTVLLEKDLGDGSGFVAANGEDVNVTLTNSSGAGYVVDTTATTCDVDVTNTDADTGTDGKCVAVFTSNTAGTVNGEASSTLSVSGVSITVSTDDTASTGDAVKVFVDGSLRWLKHDGASQLLGGATFEVCRTHRLDTSDGSYDADTAAKSERCFEIVDDDATDNDETPGELEVVDLVLGRYTVEETAPPDGYHIGSDPGAGPFTFPDMTIADPDVELVEIFVNVKAFRLIVITCDDITDKLVISKVNLDGDILDTISLDDLTAFNTANDQDLTEAEICGIGGASYGELPDDDYIVNVELPKRPEGLSAS